MAAKKNKKKAAKKPSSGASSASTKTKPETPADDKKPSSAPELVFEEKAKTTKHSNDKSESKASSESKEKLASDEKPTTKTNSALKAKEAAPAKRTEVSKYRLAFLGTSLVLAGALGYYYIPGMIQEDAPGSRAVNALYCSVMTLSTVGYGDICPGEISEIGRTFIVLLACSGIGLFCGPIMDMAGATWKDSVPGGLVGLSGLVVALGVLAFVSIEGMSHSEAIYFSIITGTTIGFGDITPKSDIGKVVVAIYAIVAVNVVAMFLSPAKDFLESFCKIEMELVVDEKKKKD